MFLAIILSFVFVLLLPHSAFAWGPATHLEIATAVLNDAAGLAIPLRALLENFPYDFLYGNISADIVVGKNLVEELKHCHHWKMGFKLLRKAQNDPQKAFAYGYLSHLAADTVAHNQFIPEMMLRSFSTNILRHIYWELRFDALADKKTWQLPKKILKELDPENDLLLDSIIEDSPLSFKTNKKIFSGLHSIQSFEHWHTMLTLLTVSSKWSLDREDREKYFNASIDSVKDFLLNQHGAACCKKDPTGKHSLNAAAHMRRRLKSIRRQGKDWEEALDNALRWVDSPKA
jgi:zinc dependent phospholipase C